MAQMVKNLPAMQETWVRSLDQENPPGKGNGDPPLYSCLENPMDRGAWQRPWGRKESYTTERLTLYLTREPFYPQMGFRLNHSGIFFLVFGFLVFGLKQWLCPTAFFPLEKYSIY